LHYLRLRKDRERLLLNGRKFPQLLVYLMEWLALLMDCINMPSSKDVSNPADYFSGHCKRFAWHAVVDRHGRFMYLCIARPGRRNDTKTFKGCQKLNNWLRSWPSRYFIVGDNAYVIEDY
jgi:hypothetical protein